MITEDELKSPEPDSGAARSVGGFSARVHQRGQNELIIQSREALARMGNELELERGKVLQMTSDITHARRELAHERTTAAGLQRDVSVLHEKETQMMRELSLLKANERVFKAKCEELERELERKEKTVGAENARMEYLESELSMKQQQQTDASKELDQYTSQSERIISDLQTQLKEVIDSEQALSEQSQARKTRLDEANEAVRACDEQLTRLQAKNKALELQLGKATTEFHAAAATHTSASAAAQQQQEANAQLRAEVARLNEVHAQYSHKTEVTIEQLNRTLESMRSSNATSALQQRGAEKDLEALTQRNIDLDHQVAAGSVRIAQLEEQVAQGNSAREALIQTSSASSGSQRQDLQRAYDERVRQIEEFGQKREAEMTALFNQRFDILKDEKTELQRQLAEKDTLLFQANAKLRGNSYASPMRGGHSAAHPSNSAVNLSVHGGGALFADQLQDTHLSAFGAASSTTTTVPATAQQVSAAASAVEAELRRQVAALEHKRSKLKRKYEQELRKLKDSYTEKLARMKSRERGSLRERDDDYDKALSLLKSRYAANIHKCKDHLKSSHALLVDKRKDIHALEHRVKQEVVRGKQLAAKVAQLQSIRHKEMSSRSGERQAALVAVEKRLANEQKMRALAEQEAQKYSEQLSVARSRTFSSGAADSARVEQQGLLDALRGIVNQATQSPSFHDDNSCVLDGASSSWQASSSSSQPRHVLMKKLDRIIERVERQLDGSR
jgi:chromosome segregation ATPase